ncbi:PucR family transcriptional regulator [Fredinandcohnia humi]
MIEKLKKHYNDSMIIANMPTATDKYAWFMTETGTFFGIELASVTSEEITLLSSLFTPYGKYDEDMTDTESYWYHFLFLNHGAISQEDFPFTHCRLIYFHANRPIPDKQDFREAVQALLPKETIFLWENDSNVVLVETRADEAIDDPDFKEVTVALTSDFYVDFHLFIGQTHTLSQDLHKVCKNEKEMFQKAMQYNKKQKVYYPHDVVPFLLLESMDSTFRAHLRDIIPLELHQDQELIETIKVFFESDLNVSNASKRLYMHRNSLQYRIEKFIEKTGIDIKHFQGAFTTYLAILTLEHFSDS